MSDIQTPPVGTEEETVTPPVTPAENPVPPVTEPPVQPEVDYKEKFVQSARENEVMRAKLDELETRNKPLTINPTEQELRDMYPEWESYLPSESQILRENLTLKKTIQQTSQTVAEMQADLAWQKDLKAILKNPDFAGIKGREEQFEEFVFKPTHKGVSIATLAKAFLYDPTKDVSPPPIVPAPEGGIERGGSGRQERPKPKELTAEELKTLRQTDSKAYNEYVKTHDITFDL